MILFLMGKDFRFFRPPPPDNVPPVLVKDLFGLSTGDCIAQDSNNSSSIMNEVFCVFLNLGGDLADSELCGDLAPGDVVIHFGNSWDGPRNGGTNLLQRSG